MLTGRFGCLAWVQLLVAGLGCGFVGVSFSFCGVAWRWGGGGGRQKSGTFLEIGADGFFDHTGESCQKGGIDLEVGADVFF